MALETISQISISKVKIHQSSDKNGAFTAKTQKNSNYYFDMIFPNSHSFHLIGAEVGAAFNTNFDSLAQKRLLILCQHPITFELQPQNSLVYHFKVRTLATNALILLDGLFQFINNRLIQSTTPFLASRPHTIGLCASHILYQLIRKLVDFEFEPLSLRVDFPLYLLKVFIDETRGLNQKTFQPKNCFPSFTDYDPRVLLLQALQEI